MNIFLTVVATVLFSQQANACLCAKVNDFYTTATALTADEKKASKYILVEAIVTSIPEVHPTWGYPMSSAVGLEVVKLEAGGANVPPDITLRFPFAGGCDGNPSLFTKDKRYLILLEKTKDARSPFKYPGNPCDQAMVEIVN